MLRQGLQIEKRSCLQVKTLHISTKIFTKHSSDKNYPCCGNCQFLESGLKCRDAQYSTCQQEAYCDGKSAICPKSKAIEDGTECQDKGKCISGTCTSFCETRGFESCMCGRGRFL